MEIIFDSGYKIDDELEADRVALQLLAQTSYDPLALRRYLLRAEKLAATSDKQTSHTHPITQQRIDELNRLIVEEGLDELEYNTAEGRFTRYVKTH
jgi:predicted Zn-dependent protease